MGFPVVDHHVKILLVECNFGHCIASNVCRELNFATNRNHKVSYTTFYKKK